VRHWTWRLFRREWRQQLLIIGLLTLAVGTSLVGAAAATNIPPPADFGFGTAKYMLTLPTTQDLSSTLTRVSRAVGPVQVIENQALHYPGSVNTYDLRAMNPHGAYGGPLLSLVSGHYPVGGRQVAVTSTVASALDLHVGSTWRLGATTREVVGIVENPQSLLDAFALVAPGQVTSPTQVSILFDRSNPRGLGQLSHFVAQPPPAQKGISSPATLVILADALGLILIGLISIAGFTVIAQRRLRSLGMIRALGATDRNVRSVVRTNGLLVGVTSVVAGTVLGLVVWLLYRPDLESTQHHVIGLWQLPWLSVAAALVLALLTPVLASGRPGRTVARVPVVTALAGRPAAPKSVTRTALPGIVVMIVSFLLLGDAARSNGSTLPLLLGFVALAVGVVLLAPTFVASLAGIRRAPLSVRLATRDLMRYRARSASTLAAISIGVLTAMVVMIATTARYANVLDYVGPNMTSNQLVLYSQNQGGGGPLPSPSLATATTVDHGIAKSLHATGDVALYQTSATLNRNAPGRQYSGPLYVATPALLSAFHIDAASLNPRADVLTMRPGLAGTTEMQLVWGNFFGAKPGPRQPVCRPSDCLNDPVMETVSALPLGTSAPNTVITEHAVTALHLTTSESLAAWLISTPQPLTTAQISAARQTAGAAGMSIESKSSLPTSAEVTNYATGAALVIALFVLAMSIGLIRAETAGDRRTLAAAGASARTRRAITAATGGALALLGAVLGSAGAYVATAAFFSNSPQNEAGGLLNSLTQVPAVNLLAIFVGLPLLAIVGGWLLAGREPRDLGRAPE